MRWSLRTVWVGLAAIAAALVVIVSCGGSGTTSSTSGKTKDDLKKYEPGTERRTKVDDRTFTVNKAARKYVVGVTFPHFKDPYWISEAYGVQEEANRLGITVRINAATGYGDTSTQLRQLDTYLTQQVDGLIIGAVDSKGIAPAADRAWNQGIPVSYANALADSKKTMGVYTDDQLAGTKQADYMAEKDPNAKVVALCGPPGVVWPKLRCEAFKKELHDKAPNAVILAEKYHDMDRAKIAEVAGNTFQAFPQATWAYNSTDLQAKGVFDALRAAGRKPGEVKITNLTMGVELFDIMKQGWITYALAEQAVLQGKLAVDQLVMVLNGEHPPANWAVDLPGFEGTPAGIQAFESRGSKWESSPPSYRP